jgi:hypothetical protein
VLDAAVRRPSGKGIVYSAIDVKKWAEEIPSTEQVRPGCCSRCGAASRPAGAPLVVVGHGLRERQVRGPASASEGPTIMTVFVRRYRCRRCGGLTTVLPRGLCARRHYSASAIGMALCLFGATRLTIGETRRRVCASRAGFETDRWTTLAEWLTAIQQGRLLSRVRPSPLGFSLRDRAERAAMTLAALATTRGTLEPEVFEGAALAA